MARKKTSATSRHRILAPNLADLARLRERAASIQQKMIRLTDELEQNRERCERLQDLRD
jgi:hypothetical protein